MKTTFIKITSCITLGVLMVSILFGISDKLTHENNNFHRFFPPHPIKYINSIDLTYNSYYFAGSENNKIYLSNLTAPLHLLEINEQTLDTSHITLQVENSKKFTFSRNTRVAVWPPYFFIADGIAPRLLRGRLGTWFASRFMYDSAYFGKTIPIGTKSFILKAISSKSGEYVLGKETNKFPYVRLVPRLLQKQIDGIFCTDGMLHYNKSLSKLIYLYHYRNQYMLIDTSLNLLSYGKTIDTNSKAKIESSSIVSESSRTIAAPPLMVNKNSYTLGALLFVHSNLMAKNETKETFNKTSVFDVYNIKENTYAFSFYIYPYNGLKPNRFMVTNKYILAIHQKYLIIYSLDPNWFSGLLSKKKEEDISAVQ